jgi:type II secretory pathway component PulC
MTRSVHGVLVGVAMGLLLVGGCRAPQHDAAALGKENAGFVPVVSGTTERLVLAGTFQREDVTKAVLEDTVNGEQHIVGVGDSVADTKVIDIQRDKILVQQHGVNRWLTLQVASQHP